MSLISFSRVSQVDSTFADDIHWSCCIWFSTWISKTFTCFFHGWAGEEINFIRRSKQFFNHLFIITLFFGPQMSYTWYISSWKYDLSCWKYEFTLFTQNLCSFVSFPPLKKAGAGSQRPSIVGGRNIPATSVYFSAVTAMLSMNRGSDSQTRQTRQRGSFCSDGSGGGGGGVGRDGGSSGGGGSGGVGEERKGSLISGSGSMRSRASSSAGLVTGGGEGSIWNFVCWKK